MAKAQKAQRDFMDNFWDCCDYSIEGELYEQAKDSDEYRRLHEESDRLYDEIEALLGKNRQLINDFDAAKFAVENYFTAPIYQQGFLDCVSLLRWLTIL